MKSYDDPAKKLSREKEMEFIRKNLAWQLKKPERIRVACLESAQLLEIKQVFDPLNIPRSNITVIEKSKLTAKEIKDQESGVNVVNCTDFEFFESYNGAPFHIISLDYTGNKHPNIGSTLEYIAARQLLMPESILIINTYGAQEGKAQQEYLKRRANLNFDLNKELADRFINSDKISLTFNLYVFQNLGQDQELKDSRDSFTKEVIRILSLGVSAREWIVGEYLDFVLCHPQSQAIIEDIKLVSIKKNMPRSAFYALEMSLHRDSLTKYLSQLLDIDAKAAYAAVEQLHIMYGKSYFVKDLVRYKYISNSGSPMEMDVFSIYRDDITIKKLIPFISFKDDGHGKVLIINKLLGLKRFFKIMSKNFDDFQKKSGKYVRGEIPERIFLGSAAKMLKE
ncbi:MAG TPA: hypothetical protein ENN28_01415 [Candidatus Uhrbacteria bacterium]|nr:hypothetical protein [Candidatus Uhrbacteria bacterium]